MTAKTPAKTVLVSGASGFVGSALCQALSARGHQVRRLSRSGGDVQWDLEAESLDAGALEGVDAVVHLAGEPIAQRWSSAAKARILHSRVRGTQLLAEAVAAQSEPPALICASGANYYGYDRAELVDERSHSGDGFLAEVCREWEGAAHAAIAARARTVFVRTGIVLSADGGALAKMLPPFKWGLGGRIGSGRQRMSWIGLSDLVRVYLFAIENESVRGAVNAVVPQPVCNLVFTKTLGDVLGRPTAFPLPASLVKTLFGEMGQETVLADLGVLPTHLQELGFQWESPDLESTLKATLNDND